MISLIQSITINRYVLNINNYTYITLFYFMPIQFCIEPNDLEMTLSLIHIMT